MKKVVILGAGFGGLSAGWMLAKKGNYNVKVVESAPVTGGMCGTFEFEDFLLDYGPHKAYSVIPGIVDELKNLMGTEFLKHEKRNSIFLFNSFLKYPVRMLDLATKMGFKNVLACGMSALAALAKKEKNSKATASYESYMIEKFGKRIYKLVFEPLADKIWGDPSTLSADIARARIPTAGIADVILRSTGLKKESELTDAKYFYYPRQGFGRIAKRMEQEIIKLGGEVLTDATPLKINKEKNTIKEIPIKIKDKIQTLPCDLLISSLPLDSLVTLLGAEQAPGLKDPLDYVNKLQYRAVFLVYLFLNQELVTKHHWIFFPQKDIIFGRVFETKRMSLEVAPKKKTVICCDFTDFQGGPLWSQSDEELTKRCIEDLEKVGIIEKAWVKNSLLLRIPKFYPRYDISYKDKISAIYNCLKKYNNLLLTGRIGFYNYNNSDHCLDMGRFIADGLEEERSTQEIWTELEERVANYRIVD